MTGLHQFLANVVVIEGVLLLAAALWSFVAARRSAGPRDHRFAVDRLILLGLVTVVANGLVGGVQIAGASRPSDSLHLLYGVAAFVTPLVGWWLAGRATLGDGSKRRRARQDGWIVAASVVSLALAFRLFMTG